ncbi:YfdQ family protein [Acidovorax sp. ACV02]|uniref:DUF2303 family protein n=1 Tax=Acidovorax sp. ACV02 TaxID=2769310 RepID=UPI00177F561A|nr:DUF2303 family protein [Acidovorax sp. ACV02]MBD9406236.1 YfdQ family protein [Acidovorax sp. ACV02]
MGQQEKTETEARDELAACNQGGYQFAGTPGFILPEGYEFKELSHLLPAPTRKKGTTTLNDAESFIAVVNDQKAESRTRLFSTIDPPTFTAVFNHIGAEAGWGDHRARYNAPLSPEWKAWNGMNGVHKSQVELAQFIENNLVDVVNPDGATLLEICRTLEAKKKVNFASAIRLSDGSHQFTYEEDVQGTAQKGQLKVPEEFIIGIPVFENGAKWQLNVRLRYRIQDGGRLTMWIELIRPHKTIEAAVAELRKQIADETKLPILNGTPNT